MCAHTLNMCMEQKIIKGNGVVAPRGLFRYVVWALFGNADDGPIGDAGWNPQRIDNWWWRLKWWVRNPFHNFCFYTLGNKHKDVDIKGWPTVDVFTRQGGWCLTWAKTDGFMRFPFVSYIGRIKFYVGWRLGNSFGIKLTANSKR